ncbi:MAG: diphthine synthase [Nitrososphaera sp.]
MLLFAGTGIDGVRGLSLAALDELKKCDTVCVERFTSYLSDRDLEELRNMLDKQPELVARWYVEDGREILERAKNGSVALITYGDPLIATTHSELRTRAAARGIPTRIMHSASGISALIGETGLQYYRFGRTSTVMADPHSAISVYEKIRENILSGSHSLVLLEYNNNSGPDAPPGSSESHFLEPRVAFGMLEQVEKDQELGLILPRTFVIVASRIGSRDQRILSGPLERVMSAEFGEGPHSIIIPASLHFTELEYIEQFSECLGPASDNGLALRTVSERMMSRYAPKAKSAVRQMRGYITAHAADTASRRGVFEVLDNAEYYILDAERFLNQHKPELAVLSIGYAEGLIDALRYQWGINPWEHNGDGSPPDRKDPA